MKLKSKKTIGLIGALLFAFSMMLSHVPSDVIASNGEVLDSACNGDRIQCASHLPEYLR